MTGLPFQSTSPRIYSAKPPSSRASYSRSTRLYGPTARREVIPVPLGRLVRSALPGAVADRRPVMLSPVGRRNDADVPGDALT